MSTPETKVKIKCRNFLKDKGWYIRSLPSTVYSRAGNPDYYAIKNGVVLFIECKSSTGKMSGKQLETMMEIKNHGGHYIIVYDIDDILKYRDRVRIEI